MPISNLEISRAVPNANPGFDLDSQRSTPGPGSSHSPFRPQNLSNIFPSNASFTPLVDMLKTSFEHVDKCCSGYIARENITQILSSDQTV
jgi:hypothetical protein